MTTYTLRSGEFNWVDRFIGDVRSRGLRLDFVSLHFYGNNSSAQLLIDTVGTNDQSWLDKAGHPHSVDAHIQERYTRVDHNHMQMVVTVDDPKIYTKPFILSKNEYRWIPDQEAEEQMCVPSEMIKYMSLIGNPSFHPAGEAKPK